MTIRPFLAASALAASFFLCAAAAPQPPPPGVLVDVGGWRLHLNCTGAAGSGPAVVFEAGGGDFSLDWALVQPAVSRFSRACSYDRAGAAWSDLGPRPRTMQQIEFELHTALRRADVNGPYVLVGQSIGGLLIRQFAKQFPAEVAGLVFVDPTTEESVFNTNGKLIRERDLSTGRSIPAVRTSITSAERSLLPDETARLAFLAKQPPPEIAAPYDQLPEDVKRLRLWAMAQPAHYTADGGEYWPEEFQLFHDDSLRTPHPLGDLPVVILTRGPQTNVPHYDPTIDTKRIAEKAALLKLSNNSELVIVAGSGHHIQLDAPGIVIAAVRDVVEAARNHQRLKQAGKTLLQ